LNPTPGVIVVTTYFANLANFRGKNKQCWDFFYRKISCYFSKKKPIFVFSAETILKSRRNQQNPDRSTGTGNKAKRERALNSRKFWSRFYKKTVSAKFVQVNKS
jgi:hypothetical protein